MAAAEGELWHSTVRKMLLSENGDDADDGAGGTPLGVLYLDLAPRHGKSTQPALYTLRGASMTTAATSAAASPRGTRADHPPEDPRLLSHLPAAALVVDLPSTGLGADPTTGAALLTLRQLETLYHEMGHAVHALVARTECQHFAVPRDRPRSNRAAEGTPSARCCPEIASSMPRRVHTPSTPRPPPSLPPPPTPPHATLPEWSMAGRAHRARLCRSPSAPL